MPDPNNSPVNESVSKENKNNKEKRSDGMYVFSANAFLSISMTPKKALCKKIKTNAIR